MNLRLSSVLGFYRVNEVMKAKRKTRSPQAECEEEVEASAPTRATTSSLATEVLSSFRSSSVEGV